MPLPPESNNPHLEIPGTIGPSARDFSVGYPGLPGGLRDFLPAIGDHFARLTSVIGSSDDRRIIGSTRKLPWRAICSIEIETATGLKHGTGWLASPNLVVTAAHCLFHTDFGGWAREARIMPGRTLRGAHYGTYTSATFMVTQEWLHNTNAEMDIGAIHIREGVAEQVGWLAYLPVDLNAMRDVATTISGYPEYAGSWSSMLEDSSTILTVLDNRAYYTADTDAGQSGSPLWTFQDNGTPVVCGVHAYGTEATPATVPFEANSAVLITPEIHTIISQWAHAGLNP
jgi:V8-like Glu-specific endopeptidase